MDPFNAFFLQAETPPAIPNQKFESLKKDPPQAPFLSVWIVSKKNWLRQSENIFSNLFFKIIIYIVISFILFYFISLLLLYAIFLYFSFFLISVDIP